MASTPFNYFDLIETFAKPGCALCNLLLRDTDRFIDSLLYEYVMETDTQQTFRAARGLCNEHSWRLTHYQGGGALNIAVLYQATLDEVLNAIKQAGVDNPSPSWLGRFLNGKTGGLADALEPSAPCMVCESLNAAEKHYVLTICQHMADPRLQAAYRASEGLCLPHFRRTLREMTDPDNLQVLIVIQTAIWTKLYAELGTFREKYDFNRAGEIMGSEGDSWLRALARMAGERGVFGIQRR